MTLDTSLRKKRCAIPFSRNFFARVTVAATFVLIFAGGLVTSTGSGLAVPDWPLSFGMLFPPMVGGVLYEHGHRMIAGTVAILTAILAAWTWRAEERRWVRNLAVAALAVVLLQALLGGITVLFLLPTGVSVAHACLAQAFFCMVVTLALVTGQAWLTREARPAPAAGPLLGIMATATTAAVYGQLILGAIMRHSGAGLAIPDFPLAFGRLVPDLTSTAVAIHFIHRFGAFVVTVSIVCTVSLVLRRFRREPLLLRPALALLLLVKLQISLGAATIWTAMAVLPTTAHVATGAAILATSLVLTLRAHRLLDRTERAGAPAFEPQRVPA